jgi:hypothetical protein
LSRAPTSLPRDQFKSVRGRTQQNRLQDPPLADRLSELGNRFLIEMHTRLGGIWPNSANFYLSHARRRHSGRRFVGRLLPDGLIEQGGKATPQTRTRSLVTHAASAI